MTDEVLNKMGDLITAGLGLVAALAWNSAIQSIFSRVFTEEGTILGQVLYAVIVTFIAVFATIWIGKLIKKNK